MAVNLALIYRKKINYELHEFSPGSVQGGVIFELVMRECIGDRCSLRSAEK